MEPDGSKERKVVGSGKKNENKRLKTITTKLNSRKLLKN